MTRLREQVLSNAYSWVNDTCGGAPDREIMARSRARYLLRAPLSRRIVVIYPRLSDGQAGVTRGISSRRFTSISPRPATFRDDRVIYRFISAFRAEARRRESRECRAVASAFEFISPGSAPLSRKSSALRHDLSQDHRPTNAPDSATVVVVVVVVASFISLIKRSRALASRSGRSSWKRRKITVAEERLIHRDIR